MSLIPTRRALCAALRYITAYLTPGHAAAAALAVAALVYSWRQRTAPPARRRRRRPRAAAGAGMLAGVQRVTIGVEGAANGALFDGDLVLREEAAGALRAFARQFDVYVLVRVGSDEGEAAVRKAFAVLEGALDERKVLFCSTVDGRVSMARQIEPQLHVDETSAVVHALQRFIKYVALVDGKESGSAAPSGSNVLRYSSLGQFF